MGDVIGLALRITFVNSLLSHDSKSDPWQMCEDRNRKQRVTKMKFGRVEAELALHEITNFQISTMIGKEIIADFLVLSGFADCLVLPNPLYM